MSNDANTGTNAEAPLGLLLGGARARIGAEGYAVTINAGRHVLVADELPALGGHDAGPSPFAILAAALGACTSTTLKRGLDEDQRDKLADVAERTPVTLALKGGVAIETRLAGGQA